MRGTANVVCSESGSAQVRIGPCPLIVQSLKDLEGPEYGVEGPRISIYRQSASVKLHLSAKGIASE